VVNIITYGLIALAFSVAHGDSMAEFLVRFAFIWIVAEALRASLKLVFR
jgi:hypothetical protein